jgi:hypothetical protein
VSIRLARFRDRPDFVGRHSKPGEYTFAPIVLVPEEGITLCWSGVIDKGDALRHPLIAVPDEMASERAKDPTWRWLAGRIWRW